MTSLESYQQTSVIVNLLITIPQKLVHKSTHTHTNIYKSGGGFLFFCLVGFFFLETGGRRASRGGAEGDREGERLLSR